MPIQFLGLCFLARLRKSNESSFLVLLMLVKAWIPAHYLIILHLKFASFTMQLNRKSILIINSTGSNCVEPFRAYVAYLEINVDLPALARFTIFGMSLATHSS